MVILTPLSERPATTEHDQRDTTVPLLLALHARPNAHRLPRASVARRPLFVRPCSLLASTPLVVVVVSAMADDHLDRASEAVVRELLGSLQQKFKLSDAHCKLIAKDIEEIAAEPADRRGAIIAQIEKEIAQSVSAAATHATTHGDMDVQRNGCTRQRWTLRFGATVACHLASSCSLGLVFRDRATTVCFV
jgi:hypothetical protein